jgi:hypothetical protein
LRRWGQEGLPRRRQRRARLRDPDFLAPVREKWCRGPADRSSPERHRIREDVSQVGFIGGPG